MIETFGILLVALLGAGVLLIQDRRKRACAVLATLTATPLLLLVAIWDSASIAALRERPLVLLLALVVGSVAVAGLVLLFNWRPAIFALLAAAALPFRVPLELGGSTGKTVNLLLPLYLVIAGGGLAWAIRQLRQGSHHALFADMRGSGSSLATTANGSSSDMSSSGSFLDKLGFGSPQTENDNEASFQKQSVKEQKPFTEFTIPKPGFAALRLREGRTARQGESASVVRKLRRFSLRSGLNHERPSDYSLWVERVLAATLLLYALQATYSSDTTSAFQQMVFFYSPFAVMFALVRELKWTQQLVKSVLGIWVGLALLCAGVGLWEYLDRTILLNPRIINANQIQEYFRVNSLFYDPNMYGRFLVIVILALAAVLIWTRKGSTVAVVSVTIAALAASLLLTLSQTSFVALLIGLISLAAIRFSKRWVLGGSLTLGVLALSTLILLASQLGINFESVNNINKVTSGRINLIEGGLSLAKSRPMTGYGSGSFPDEYERRNNSRSQAVSASHTIPITVAAEQGIGGLALYFGLICLAITTLFRATKSSATRAFLGSAFIALVAHTWSYAAFLEDPMVWAILAVGVVLGRVSAKSVSNTDDLVVEQKDVREHLVQTG